MTFMIAYSFPILSPITVHLLLYIQLLANSFKSVATVKNYLSGAKSFLTQQGVFTNQFDSPLISNLFRGIAKISTHVPIQAPPLLPIDIKRMCDLLSALNDNAHAAKAAILLGFVTFSRQSNLLPSIGGGSSHVIRCQDVEVTDGQLWVTVNSSKTIHDPRDRVCIPVYS